MIFTVKWEELKPDDFRSIYSFFETDLLFKGATIMEEAAVYKEIADIRLRREVLEGRMREELVRLCDEFTRETGICVQGISMSFSNVGHFALPHSYIITGVQVDLGSL